MRHLGTLPLQAGEYHLRRITMKDVPAAYQNWLSDPECCRFLRSAPHRSPAETEGFLAEQVARYCDRTRYFWAIADRNDQPVGCIGVSVPLRGTTGSVVFIVGRPWWGQGIASSCLREVLRFLFEDVGFRRIEGVCACRNPASGAVMRRAGMEYECALSLSLRTGDGPQPCERYSVAAEDWLQKNADGRGNPRGTGR